MMSSHKLNHVNKILANMRNVDKEFAKQLNSKDIKFPLYTNHCAKIKEQNNITTKVFFYEDQTP